MKERPILMSTPMVKAILEDRKNQTRRMIKPQPPLNVTDIIKTGKDWVSAYPNRKALKPFEFSIKCPYGQIGDILWVRETFAVHEGSIQGSYAYSEGEAVKYPPHFLDKKGIKRCIDFKADYPKASLKWKPSIFMPKEACRIKLLMTDIRVERIQDISEEDAKNEGIEFKSFPLEKEIVTGYKIYNLKDSWDENPIGSYGSLWEFINGKNSWSLNPWVWVIKFERI